MSTESKKLNRSLIFGFIFLVSVFIYSRAHDAISGARLVIKNLDKYTETTEPFITINGYMKRSAKISINGVSIPTDQEGNFNYPLALGTGYNSVEVKGLDSFGRTKVENFNIQVVSNN